MARLSWPEWLAGIPAIEWSRCLGAKSKRISLRVRPNHLSVFLCRGESVVAAAIAWFHVMIDDANEYERSHVASPARDPRLLTGHRIAVARPPAGALISALCWPIEWRPAAFCVA